MLPKIYVEILCVIGGFFGSSNPGLVIGLRNLEWWRWSNQCQMDPARATVWTFTAPKQINWFFFWVCFAKKKKLTKFCCACLRGVLPRTLPVLLPYDIMEYLISSCQLKISDGAINSYWSHLESVNDTWALNTKQWRDAVGRVWPLGLYGDEACMGLITDPYNQIYGIFMNVILFRPKATRLARYMLMSVESDAIESVENTIFPVLDLIVESFNKLTEEGIQGTRFLVGEIRGDQAFFRYLFKHKSWWRSADVCFRCSATAKQCPLNYAIYEAPDGWNTTCRNTAEFIQSELPYDKLCSLDSEHSGIKTMGFGDLLWEWNYGIRSGLNNSKRWLIRWMFAFAFFGICRIFEICGMAPT